MLDRQRITSRIEEMRRRVKLLEKDFKPISEDKLVTNENLYAAAERHLEVAIQCCIDIGSHLIAQLGLERPKRENKEIFLILGKEGIIPKEFVQKLTQMVGYRNILVHEYLEVERHNTYVNIQEHLGDFAEFAKYIERYLQKSST